MGASVASKPWGNARSIAWKLLSLAVVVAFLAATSATLTVSAKPAASGPLCYVKANAKGFNNGNSWADAYTDLQSALQNGVCQEVWVAAGVYKPSGGMDFTVSFNIRPNTGVYGGFNGTESALTQRNPSANLTVLSGDVDNNDIVDSNGITEFSSDIVGINSDHVVTMDGTSSFITSGTTLDGFAITGGAAAGSGSQVDGGGLYCNGKGVGHECNPTLANLSFWGNQATYGAGLFDDGTGGTSSPTLTNALFIGNLAGDSGGAMMNEGGSAGLSNPSLTNVTFSGNTSIFNGGAIYNDGGGGTSDPHLTNVTFWDNHALEGGGMFDNGVSGASNPVLLNVTFSHNHASYGGGIANDSSSGSSFPNLDNVILWSDTVSLGGSEIMDFGGALPVIDYSVIKSGSTTGAITPSATPFVTGTGNLDTDPKLHNPGGFGGYTETIPLEAGSSALDTGDDTNCPGTDARGVSRPRGLHCDIGAYERIPAATDFDADYASDPAKFTSLGILWDLQSSSSTWQGQIVGTDGTYVPRSDFDGDLKADPTKWVASSDTLWYFGSTDSTWHGLYMGTDVSSILPGCDFDGDGKTDPAKYVSSTGQVWYFGSRDSTWHGVIIGNDGTPLPGSDYDGDGKTDPAKYVASSGTIWYIGSTDGMWHGVMIGNDGDPVPASDFDGDGKADPAKFLSSSNTLWYLGSIDGMWHGAFTGPGTYNFVPGNDFDGDGMTDPATFNPSTGALWFFNAISSAWQGVWLGGDTYTNAN